MSKGCGFAAVDATHGTNANAVFGAGLVVERVAVAVDFAAGRVVAVEQHLINNYASAKARAEGYAEQVLVAFRVALLFQQLVHLGTQAVEGFAVGK